VSWLKRLAYRQISDENRIELIEALLRNRAMMLDPSGREMPGVSVFGIAPTDEEFRQRARVIVQATGKDLRAAVREVEAFADELFDGLEHKLEGLGKAGGVEKEGDADTPPPNEIPS
jgi:hypothetical protein